jgi:CheY-like chemotaxis protein/HPt (histidine-containing phosphotransfer) domain-containing protein
LQTRSLKSLKILVAEDDKVNQTLLKAIFKKIGCEYAMVDTGMKILENLQGATYDLILMDIEMPDMDGYEATIKIRKEFSPPISEIPIISTTAHINDAHLRKCLEVGMNDFVFKPIQTEDLVAKIKLVLGNIDDDGQATSSASNTRATEKKGFNFQSLVMACGDNPAVAKNILKLFISQTPENMKQLKDYLSAADWNNFKNICHKVKSSYALLGFEQVKKILEEMENDCAQNNLNVNKFESNLSLIDVINTNIIQTLEETIKNEQ